MPQTPHIERHFTGSATIRDIIIGMSDGLTVPFALSASLSSAVDTTSIVVIAGLAEIAAGSISMGLGGYLAARSDAEHYQAEEARENREVDQVPEVETAEVRGILQSYGLTSDESATVANTLRKRRGSWIDFMMRFELGLEKPDPKRALLSAITIAGSYIVGGFIPLSPYIILSDLRTAMIVSIVVTAMALLIFGYVKGRFTSVTPVRSAFQTALVGALAAATAFAIARAIS